MNPVDQVLAGASENGIFFKVEGRGHFQNSHPLKEYALSALAKKERDVFLDLAKCTGMDSTFMGVLAGLALELKKMSPYKMRLMHLSLHNRELLETLGLIHLFEVVENLHHVPPKQDSLAQGSLGKESLSSHMLEAHKTLSALNELNGVKFKNVIQILEEGLKQKNP